MGFTLMAIHAVISYLIGKILIKSKPEIFDWSVNKKQALTLLWFFTSVLIWLSIKAMLQDFAIEQHLFSSIGTSIIMGMIFHTAISSKNKIA